MPSGPSAAPARTQAVVEGFLPRLDVLDYDRGSRPVSRLRPRGKQSPPVRPRTRPSSGGLDGLITGKPASRWAHRRSHCRQTHTNPKRKKAGPLARYRLSAKSVGKHFQKFDHIKWSGREDSNLRLLRPERSGLRGPSKIAELLNRYVFGSALARFQDEIPQAL